MSLTTEQLEMRRTGITATDAVVIANLSPYHGASAHTVYAEKIGIELPRKTSEAFEMGHELEPIILRRLASKRSLTLVPGLTVRSNLWQHHLATPDAIHDPGAPEAVCEAKAVGLHYADAWGADDDGVPDHVIAQVHWQMHVTGLHLGYVGALIGTEVRTYRVERDDDLIAALVDAADRFWTDHVVARKPPPIDGSEGCGQLVRAMFAKPRGPMRQADEDVEGFARAYLNVKRDLDRNAQLLEGAKQALIAACADAEGIEGNGWRLRYAWRDECRVTPKPYTKAAGRYFDLREVSKR